MLYRRVKQMFKRKKKVVDPIYKLEPSDFKEYTKQKGRTEECGFLWDDNGTDRGYKYPDSTKENRHAR